MARMGREGEMGTLVGVKFSLIKYLGNKLLYGHVPDLSLGAE